MKNRHSGDGFMPSSVSSFAASCCIALMISACGDRAPDVAAPDTSAAKQTQQNATAAAAAAEQETMGMSDGMPNGGKPGAPVQLKYEVQGTPAAGVALPIEIAVMPRAATPSIRVSFIATDGLVLGPGTSPEFSAAVADSVHRHTLTVTPREDGEYYLGVIVVMSMPNGPEARTFNIPVLVGAAAKARTAPSKSTAPPVDATGQPIQSMPGQTDTSPRPD
jgi:hypothetical protein